MVYRHTLCAAIIAALSIGASSCSKSDSNKADATPQEELPKVELQQVHVAPVSQLGEYTATVEAFKTNNISSSTPNRIKSILVDVGSRVAAGQKVVVLDDVNIDQLKVRLQNTEREYNRAVKLLEIGAGTQQSVDQLKTELDASRRQYTNMVENTVLVSPISGVVTARNYDPGDMTSTLPILTIEQVQPVKIIINVSETDYTKVHTGMGVDITLDVYPGETFAGTVHLIHPTVDPATRTFTVEITINNAADRVLPGMFARATLNFGTENRVVVPDRAVVKQVGSGNKYIYVYDPATHTVSYDQVELGQRVDNTYEVLSGVSDGALVVMSGQARLASGVKVEPIDSQAASTATAPDSTASK
ncbi:MAG: efflux RND transporter periplasmic adaptor subunit [Muribaculaceae bacterium]|nr:efflux RND transporter periplasmic adaptor subunit [Muribaculaceae bacterium]